MIEHLEWDSRFFKIKIGRVQLFQLTESILSELYIHKAEGGFELIYLFCKEASSQNEAFIVKKNGALVDLKVTYHKPISPKPLNEIPSIENYSGPLTDELLELALASGHQSRFKKDPKLAPFYNSLYTQWILKSLDGSLADAILVHRTDNKMTGFVTLKNNAGIGQIVLIAVNAQERGKGIGRQLLQAADNWYRANTIQHCTVVTQLDNLAACKLYENHGYTIEKIERIYHL